MWRWTEVFEHRRGSELETFTFNCETYKIDCYFCTLCSCCMISEKNELFLFIPFRSSNFFADMQDRLLDFTFTQSFDDGHNFVNAMILKDLGVRICSAGTSSVCTSFIALATSLSCFFPFFLPLPSPRNRPCQSEPWPQIRRFFEQRELAERSGYAIGLTIARPGRMRPLVRSSITPAVKRTVARLHTVNSPSSDRCIRLNINQSKNKRNTKASMASAERDR